MYGTSQIKRINKTESGTSPVATLEGVGIATISSIPLVGEQQIGFKPVGEPVKATLDGGEFVESLDLAGTRKWIKDVGAKFVGFTKQGASVGILQAFEPVSV